MRCNSFNLSGLLQIIWWDVVQDILLVQLKKVGINKILSDGEETDSLRGGRGKGRDKNEYV